MSNTEKFFVVFGVLILVVMVFLLWPFLIMLAWNYIAPLFGLPKIGWLHAFVISFLCSAFFGRTTINNK